MELINSLVASVAFEQATYSVIEDETVHVMLNLSKSSSTEVTIEVYSSNMTASGEACMHKYNYLLII